MRKYFLLFSGALLCKGAIALSQQDRLEEAQLLGWTSSNNICQGYFGEPPIPGGDKPLPSIKDTPTTITADSSTLKNTGVSTLSGNVQFSQPGRIIHSQQADLVMKEGEYQTANLKGQVTIREPEKIAVANEAELDLKQQWYRLTDVIYRLFVGNNLSGWGKASSATQPPSGITEMKNITYSTCPPQSRAWNLSAETLDLNQDTGRGKAYNAVLYAQGIPIFYSPYFNFPIDSRRQSGFLYPQFSFGGLSGFGMGFPYYFNIAPNLDDTLTPFVYAKRGFLFNNQFRYLTSSSNGIFNLSILPNDLVFRQFQQQEPLILPTTPGINDLIDANSTRSLINWMHNTQFNSDWAGSINYTRVSDDYYPQDIGNVPMVAQNQLLQQGKITYTGDDYNFLANFQGFQTLHPVNQAFVSNQYSMLPQLLLTSRYQPKLNAFNYQWSAEAVNFTETQNPGELITPPSGQRFNLIPSISLPLTNIAGFFIPKLSAEVTQYNIGNQLSGFSNEITRALPIFDIDSGLYFQRNTNLFSHDYTQPLEPRIFYLYVPYNNQSDIPIFDSSLQPFSFNQLFLTNRFTGSDRIGDANQISFALSTRFLDSDSGDEKFSAGLGIIKYFEDRQVTLCNTPDCIDSLYAVGSTSTTSTFSPIVGQMQYHFNPNWNTTLNAAWDPSIAQTQNAGVTVQYLPLPNHVFNLGYNYIRHGDFFTLPNQTPGSIDPDSSQFNLSQPSTSFAWPLNDRWNLIGSLSYSLNQHHVLTYFGGVEYNSCCWAIQVVMAKAFYGFDAFAVPQYNTGIYVQWAFKGLAKVAANDPTTMILTGIPGYQDPFNVL
jgi:LPS-assembly protein